MSTVTIKNDGEEQDVSLADIAGIDMADIEEFEGGFEPTPKGVFKFNCTDAKIETIETKNGDKAIIRFDCLIEEVLALVDDSIDGDKLVGEWTHQEAIFVSDVKKSVGQAKAIMSNAGYIAQGTLEELLDGFVGTEFYGAIKQRKDPNDSDRVYANLIIKKIKPVVAEEQGAVATA